MKKRIFGFPKHLAARLEACLRPLGYSLHKPENLSAAVIQLSRRYTSERNAADIWQNPAWRAAYLAYFLPLNFLRLSAVIGEGKKLGFFDELTQLIELGSGPGTLSLAFAEAGLHLPAHFMERSETAREIHQQLLPSSTAGIEIAFSANAPSIPRQNRHLAAFVYSFNELDHLPAWALECQAILLVEPSMATESRRLMSLRDQLKAAGFSLWAPCCHQEDCPLLVHSKRDWCYDRIFVEKSEWYEKLERRLPMRNNTLTYSYLLAKKQTPPHAPRAGRIIGDTLKEKGKTRQAICRSSEREFLSWLKRQKNIEPFAHGEAIELPEGMEKKGNELRFP